MGAAARRGDRRGAEGLVPFGSFADGNAAEAAKLERLRSAWPLLVGPGLCRHTHPISIAGGLLLIGCHDTFALKSMRAGAESAWPDLRGRINAAVGTHLQRVEITPSDPPQDGGPGGWGGPARAEAGAAAEGSAGRAEGGAPDPLDAVLRFYAAK